MSRRCAPGDRVVLSWAPACGECGACRRGRPAACAPLSAAIGRGTLLDGRDGDLARRRDGLPRHRDRRARRAGRRRGRRRPAARRRHPARAGGAARLRGAHRRRGRAERRAARARLHGARDRRGRRGPVRRPGRADRRGGAILAVDPVEARREQALPARRDATPARRTRSVRPCVRSIPRASTTPSTRSARRRRRRLRCAGRAAAGTAVVVGLAGRGREARRSTRSTSRTARRRSPGRSTAPRIPAVVLPRLLELVARGELELASLVGPCFPLDAADDAFRASLAGRAGPRARHSVGSSPDSRDYPLSGDLALALRGPARARGRSWSSRREAG